MEHINIFKELKGEFTKYADENNQLSDIRAQRACWKFGIYPSSSQIFEIHQCRSEDNCVHNLEFHEYCLLVAAIKSDVDRNDEKTKFHITPTSIANNGKPRWDVFLGGACNPTTWRFDVAIPFLKEKNITFYNPQVSQWEPSLIEVEETAKQMAKVLLFVFDIYRTRGIASLVEAAYLSGQGRNLVLVVPAEKRISMKEVQVKEIDENEFQSISRSYLFIADLVQRQGIPLFTTVSDALKATRISIISNRMVQDLTEIDGVVPVKHAYVNVSTTFRALQKTFQELDSANTGLISLKDIKNGLRSLFGCDVTPISTTKETFRFSDLCIEYSVLLLLSIYRHHEAPRSHSVVNFNIRSTSLENISVPDTMETRTAALNMKNRLSSHDDGNCKLSSTENHKENKKVLCDCRYQKRNVGVTIARLMKLPFSKISTGTGQPSDQQSAPVPLKLVPQSFIDEEKYDIFLGGTCGESNWRENIAIPLLNRKGCTYYDPKVSNNMWSRRMLPKEARAREQSKILVYVITNECTSTAALVEAAHFIGQGKKILLCVQMLPSVCSLPISPMTQSMQSSCSLSSLSPNNDNQSPFFPENNNIIESVSSGYHSISDASPHSLMNSANQFSLSPFSNKLSNSEFDHIDSVDNFQTLSMSINNISKINPLSSIACKDHNRGRKYLIDIAKRVNVPIIPTIEATIQQAISWSRKSKQTSSWV